MQLQINIGVVHIKLQSYRLIAAPCGSPGPLITSHLTAKAKGHKSTMRPFHYYCSNLYACIPMDYGPLTSNEPPFELKKNTFRITIKPETAILMRTGRPVYDDIDPKHCSFVCSYIGSNHSSVATLVLTKSQHSSSHKRQLTRSFFCSYIDTL